MRYVRLGLLAGVLLLPRAAAAQTTVINPTGISFTASADHNTSIGGFSLVTSYQLDTMVSNGTGALAFSVGLGKPTPDAAGTIAATIPNFLTMAPNTLYVATVSAIGPGGVGTSLPSDPFARLGKPTAPGKPVPKVNP